MAWAPFATMSLARGLCRLPLPTAFISSSYIMSLSASRSRALRSDWSKKAPLKVSLSSYRFPYSPHPVSPSFSKAVLIPTFTFSLVVGALGSSSFSSSASAVGTTPEDVLDFWFKGVGPESGVYSRQEWFNGGPEFDGECERKFGESLKLASTGALNELLTSARGRLALVILLDQISRNVYRNSAESYTQDQASIKITLETIEQGWDKELPPVGRLFLYLPLMHSEDMKHHNIVDALYENLASENSDNEKLHEQLFKAIAFERKHSAVIKRFGRYPTRNAALGRPNTKEEEEFLSKGGGW